MASSIYPENPLSTVVLGALNMDMMLETERPALAGETFEGNRFYTSPAGKGGNQAVAAARFAGNREGAVKMIARVGDDAFGTELIRHMATELIDVSDVSREEGTSSGVAVILIDRTGESFVNAAYGANKLCGEQEVEATVGALDGAGVLLVQQEIPMETSLATMRVARENGIAVILDPAPAREPESVPTDFYSFVDVITPNVHEAQALSGIEVADRRSAEAAAELIRGDLGCRVAIVTMDTNGAFVVSDEVRGHFPAFEIVPVSSVGAGDAFSGVLGAALSEGLDVSSSIEYAMAAGAMCVSKAGAQEAMAHREAIDDLIANGVRRVPT